MQALKDLVAKKRSSSVWPKEIGVVLAEGITTPGKQTAEDVLDLLGHRAAKSAAVLQIGGWDGGAMAAQNLVNGAASAHYLTNEKSFFQCFNEVCEMARQAGEIGEYGVTLCRDYFHALEVHAHTYDSVYALDFFEGRAPKKAMEMALLVTSGALHFRKILGRQAVMLQDLPDRVNRWLPTVECLEASLKAMELESKITVSKGAAYVVIFKDGTPDAITFDPEEIEAPEEDALEESSDELDTAASTDGTVLPTDMVEAFGERTAEVLVEAGYTSLADVPTTKEELIAINGIGEARAKKILEAME